MVLVLLIIVMLYVFVRPHYDISNEIDDLNNNIDLSYKFNTPVTEYDIDEERIESSDEYAIFVSKNDKVRYGFLEIGMLTP